MIPPAQSGLSAPSWISAVADRIDAIRRIAASPKTDDARTRSLWDEADLCEWSYC